MADEKEKPGLLQEVLEGVPSALDDVRHKVIEEPWYGWRNGREVTGNIEGKSTGWANGPDAWSSGQDKEQGIEFLKGNQPIEQQGQSLYSDRHHDLPNDKNHGMASDKEAELRSDREHDLRDDQDLGR